MKQKRLYRIYNLLGFTVPKVEKKKILDGFTGIAFRLLRDYWSLEIHVLLNPRTRLPLYSRTDSQSLKRRRKKS